MITKQIAFALLAGILIMGAASYAQVQTPSQTPDGGNDIQTQSQTVARSEVPTETSAPAIVVFYEDGCPHCATMENLLDEVLKERGQDLSVARYEINAPGSSALLWKLAAHYGIVATQVPVIFVGDKAIVGAGRAQEFNLRTAVGDCINIGCPSPLEYVEGGKAVLNDLLIVGVFIALFFVLMVFQGL